MEFHEKYKTDELSKTKRTITIISILFGVFFLFELYEFGRFMLVSDYVKWNWAAVFEFLSLIVMLITAILFYLRKKIGWIILTIFLTYAAVSAIRMLVLIMPKGVEELKYLTALLPLIFVLIPIFKFLFFSGIIWVISKEKIRNIYSISKRTMILTISIVIFVAVLELVMNYYFYSRVIIDNFDFYDFDF